MPSHIIYARKSTESEDRQILSVDSQIDELRSIAERRGIRIAEVLSEAKSAKAPGRPVFDQLMRRIKKGEIRGVFCWKMDRLSRNHMDTGSILQALADGKLDEIVTSDRTYTRDGNDRFMGNFELGIATKFIDDLRQNVRRGIRAKLKQGWLSGVAPLGYLNNRLEKTIEKDPDRFDHVRRMWELLLSGTMRPKEILQIADEEWGFRTRKSKRQGGKALSRSMIYRMFANPFYMGVIQLRSGETFSGLHPPMVTREEFDRVQDILGRPGRPRPKKHSFPFTGLIVCGLCGGSITAEVHTKPSGLKYVYYRCSRQKANVVCREPAISGPDLERQMQGELSRIGIPEKVYDWIKRQLEKESTREKARREEVRQSMQRSLEKVNQEVDNLLSLRLRELVDDDVYIGRKRALEDRRRAMEEKIGAGPRSSEEVDALTKKTIEFAVRAGRVFAAGTKVQKRKILDTVGLNYTLRGRKVRFSLAKPFSFVAESAASFNWYTTVDDVRTWIANTSEYFVIPDLDELTVDTSVPSNTIDDDLGRVPESRTSGKRGKA